jgi:Spy/CpxP family protein refolding chaperone
MNRKNAFWIALWVVLVVVTGYFAFFHAFLGYGPWHGWGWAGRGGYEGESYPAYRSRGGQGMPHGWMGDRRPDGEWGAGRNYGMMGPYGGAPGMGFGMPGYGMMPWSLADLTPEQSWKIAKLQAEQLERGRTLMQQIWQIQAHLNELYAADKLDWNAIRSTSQKLFDLQRQQHESVLELQQKIDVLLTDAQRQEMARPQRGYEWMGRQ